MTQKPEVIYWVRTVTGMLLLLYSISANAQNASYTQLGHELQFSRAINDKWAAELYLGGTFSNTPYENKVLKTNIQRYVFAWAHYYFSPEYRYDTD